MNSAVVLASAAAETVTAAVAVVSSVTAAIGDTAAKCCDVDGGCDISGQDLAARLEDKKKFQLRRGWDSCVGRRASVAIRVQVQQEGQ
ncbi:hypothetical protein CLOM_g1435 [Closterium sp. NIES-68]|nr:hypothetical protein CLOM_g1435 [Closterium sp. NIES-68]GJP68918.1 hypothetical protein CLOP_g25559 [Closterium sp. NIES-67]